MGTSVPEGPEEEHYLIKLPVNSRNLYHQSGQLDFAQNLIFLLLFRTRVVVLLLDYVFLLGKILEIQHYQKVLLNFLVVVRFIELKIGKFVNLQLLKSLRGRWTLGRPLGEDDIINIIIPFFDKYLILGSKHMNYLKFKEAANIIKNKQHLNEGGINRIKELKNSMNKTIKSKIN